MPSVELKPRPRAQARPPQHLVKGRGRGASPLSPNPPGASGGYDFWPSWWVLQSHLWLVQSYPIRLRTPRPVPKQFPRCFDAYERNCLIGDVTDRPDAKVLLAVEFTKEELVD